MYHLVRAAHAHHTLQGYWNNCPSLSDYSGTYDSVSSVVVGGLAVGSIETFEQKRQGFICGNARPGSQSDTLAPLCIILSRCLALDPIPAFKAMQPGP